ncbi:MAG: hypothetical protein CBR30_04180 [Dictyoglomus sp. NZ13-RE01]|nr:MAG: hypothetical protein CBR30_04180 [Dictyoglomus sp. NZ13-RE01]
MERKIWKIIFLLIVFIIFVGGCKEQPKEENNKVLESVPSKIEVAYSDEAFEDFLINYHNEVKNYEKIVRVKKTNDYEVSWVKYEIYLGRTFEDEKNKLLSFLEERKLNYNLEKTTKYNKVSVDYIYTLPNNDSINLDIFDLYFPFKKNVQIQKKHEKPLLAIVVDDFVEKNYWTDLIFSLTYTLNIAIIPNSKALELAKEAEKKNWYVIMHMPMESISYPKDAKYLISTPIMTGMSKEEIRKVIDKSLEYFKGFPIEGLNNHMGSKVTQDEETMSNLYDVLKEKGLFFLDSKTIAKSVGRKLAKEKGIEFLENNLFLDHENDEKKIRYRFQQAKYLAKKLGRAIVICHVRPKTIYVMKELEKENFFEDVELVKLKDLLSSESNPPLKE